MSGEVAHGLADGEGRGGPYLEALGLEGVGHASAVDELDDYSTPF